MASSIITFSEAAKLIRHSVQPADIGEMPYIGLEHIEKDTLRLLTIGNASNVMSVKSRFSKGDILFGKLRPYFRKVIRAPFDGVCSTDIWVVRSKPGIDQGYLYYWMASSDFVNYATQGSEGTKMPRAKWNHVGRFRQISLPETEQRSIAHILGTLDDKIELNQRMNKTLEAIARAIFKSWFVDFDPVHAKAEGRDTGLPAEIADLFPDSFVESEMGMIPKGWEISTIGEAVRCVGGSTPSTIIPAFWNNGSNPFVNPKDMSSLNTPIIITTSRHITAAGVSIISSGRLPTGTVLLSSRAPIGYLAITEAPISINQGIIAMICDKNLPNYYVLYWTEANIDTIKSNAGGTTFAEISKRNFRPIQIIIPDKHVLEAFTVQIKPLYQQLVISIQESSSLASLRDTLLPRLISGDLRIPYTENLIKGHI